MRVAVFGGSFNPPGLHHLAIVRRLLEQFDKVVIVPCGPRPDKQTVNDLETIDRAAMVDLTFGNIDRVEIDLSDLERSTYRRTYEIQELYQNRGVLWHVIGADLASRGNQGRSEIQMSWEEGERIWREFNFAVVARSGYTLTSEDLPPRSEMIFPVHSGSSTDIRQRIFNHESVDDLVVPAVASYIERHGLYRGFPPRRKTSIALGRPALMIVADEYNEKAQLLGTDFMEYESDKPNLILVLGGDGTMLRAIRQHWRLRLPFYGINLGHRGFLLNNVQYNVADVLGSRAFSTQEFVARSSFTNLVTYQARLLYIRTTNSAGDERTDLAFNDAWVQAKPGTTSWIELKVNGTTRFSRMVGDGALIATPAGSSAYARAMGATPVQLGTEQIILVGNNVLEPPAWKSALLSSESTIELRNADDTSPKRRPLLGFADGVELGEVDSMFARTSLVAAVELAFTEGGDFDRKFEQIQFPEG